MPQIAGGLQANDRFCLDQKTPPHITLISTFIEYHENTHIGPTTTFGEAYLRQTARFIAALKRKVRPRR